MAKKHKNMTGSPEMAEPYKNPEDRRSGWSEWEVRDALRTLTTAAKIRKNASLMKAVREEARKQVKAAQAVATSV